MKQSLFNSGDRRWTDGFVIPQHFRDSNQRDLFGYLRLEDRAPSPHILRCDKPCHLKFLPAITGKCQKGVNHHMPKNLQWLLVSVNQQTVQTEMQTSPSLPAAEKGESSIQKTSCSRDRQDKVSKVRYVGVSISLILLGQMSKRLLFAPDAEMSAASSLWI